MNNVHEIMVFATAVALGFQSIDFMDWLNLEPVPYPLLIVCRIWIVLFIALNIIRVINILRKG